MIKHNLAEEGRKLAREFKGYNIHCKTEMEKVLYKHALSVQASAKRKAPVDTGKLRASISVRRYYGERVAGFEIGSLADYASFVEFGTSKQAAQPYLRPALYERQEKILESIRDVYRGKKS